MQLFPDSWAFRSSFINEAPLFYAISMSPGFRIWRALVLLPLFFSVIMPSGYSFAQQSEQPILNAKQAIAKLKPIGLGGHRSPTCLIAARNSGSPLIAISDRNNISAIAKAANDAATEDLTTLGWPSEAAVTPYGARRIGNILQNSFRISIGGIPVRE